MDFEGADWHKGIELWEQPGRRSLLLNMIYSPQKAIRRLLQGA